MTNPTAYPLKLVRDFEAAVRAHEMKGAGAPEDRAHINKAYERAKEKLVRKIGQLAKDNEAMKTKLDDMVDYKDRSPL